MKKQFTLNKQERLKSHNLTEQLFKKGKAFVETPYRVIYLSVTAAQQKKPAVLLFGCGAGKRNFKKAVDRNRIKRLTREAYRLQKLPLQQLMADKKMCLSLFVLYTGKELPDFKTAQNKMSLILEKLASVFSVAQNGGI